MACAASDRFLGPVGWDSEPGLDVLVVPLAQRGDGQTMHKCRTPRATGEYVEQTDRAGAPGTHAIPPRDPSLIGSILFGLVAAVAATALWYWFDLHATRGFFRMSWLVGLGIALGVVRARPDLVPDRPVQRHPHRWRPRRRGVPPHIRAPGCGERPSSQGHSDRSTGRCRRSLAGRHPRRAAPAAPLGIGASCGLPRSVAGDGGGVGPTGLPEAG
jgi:hypothetical protein